MEFTIDGKGVRCKPAQNQLKKNRIVNRITIVLGLLSGKPAVAGAGMLANSRQDISIKWSKVVKVKYKPKRNTIVVKAGYLESIVIFCSNENYSQVTNYIKNYWKGV